MYTSYIKKFLYWIFSLSCCLLFFSFASATTTYSTATENGHAYKIMKVVLDGKSKIVVAVVDNYSPAQSLKTLMYSMGWIHAINGWYFCPDETAYSRCEGNTTNGLRISDGVLYSKRWKDIAPYSSVFGFDSAGVPVFVTDKGTTKSDSAIDTIFNGLTMPTLVKDWVNVAVFNDEMNNDPKQGIAGNKTFICSTQDNTTIYMWYVDGVTFSSVAEYIITTFGCYNAIQLDNGWSKSMIHNEQYVAGPGRNIMDAFVVVEWNGSWVTPPATNEQLQNAITWMYNAGLTMYSTIADFLPNNTMTREEASKFFGVFAENEFSKIEDTALPCNFYDIQKADPTLRNNIISACRLGIFKWYQGNFSPLDKLTNAQAITVLMRIIVGTLTEPLTAYYTNYLLKAQEFGLVGTVNVNDYTTRWAAAILLYKASIYREDIAAN